MDSGLPKDRVNNGQKFRHIRLFLWNRTTTLTDEQQQLTLTELFFQTLSKIGELNNRIHADAYFPFRKRDPRK